MRKTIFWVLLIAVVAVAVLIGVNRRITKDQPDKTDQQVQMQSKLRGVSLSPINFEPTNYLGFFSKAAEVGNTISWAGKWQDLKSSNNAAKTVLTQAKKQNITPIIITGPNKGEVYDGIFTQGFREAVINFVKNNEVPLLGLGNEIDQEYFDSPARYDTLIYTLTSLATEVKAASPNTKVFTIFQLERIKGLQGGLFGKQNDSNNNLWKLVQGASGFDYIAFTTYPCLIYKDPAEIPDEYYSEIANYTKLPIIFTEIGWFRETPFKGWESSETEQSQFIARFKSLTERIAPSVVIWPFLYDQDIAAPFKQIGLLGLDSTTSLGYEAWKQY